MDIKTGDFIGCANRCFFLINECKYYLSERYLYICDIGKEASKPIEKDHFLKWIEPSKAIAIFITNDTTSKK
ncbi:hypothetical protein [Bacillus sp. SM2101]|uniref:hypothetical protein n=1 Tax=Bacillus sp. SM2101 TaxID=2805366 RepID=UPI001BDE9106|nr:hypothetical protein [Bacillus sp. SM2101]